MRREYVTERDLFGEVVRPVKTSRSAVSGDYEGFVEKFVPKKTTDDCYTPREVYDEVLAFAVEECGIGGRQVVRPFWPGGDYERHDYPEGCVVVDNPPFSIYSRVVRFFLERGIGFFLFAPGLTIVVRGADVTYIVANADVTYENGAVVRTGFCTNLLGGLRWWLCPQLGRRRGRKRRRAL